MKQKIFFVLLFILIFSVISSCIFDDDKPTSSEELLKNGWKYYTQKRYTNSLVYINKLIARDDSLSIKYKSEAYTGKGWCEARLSLLDSSIVSFETALKFEPSDSLKNDIYAGLSFVYDALDEYDLCLSATNNVSSDWTFYHDDLDHNDIIILRAINYYAKGDFSNSMIEVQKLDAGFTVDDIKTVEGRADLADKIEKLRNESPPEGDTSS